MNQRKKPDLLWILVFIFGLGVVTTGYAQGFWERKLDTAIDKMMMSLSAFVRDNPTADAGFP